MIWVKDGDDPDALRVAVELSSYHIDVISLKLAIMDDPTLNHLYDSANLFALFHAGKQLDDNGPLANLSANDTLVCKLILPEVYKISMHRESRKTNVITQIKTLGTFQRLVNDEDTIHGQRSFLELSAPIGRLLQIINFECLDEENEAFDADVCYYKYDDASDSFDKYTFDPQNIFFVKFEIKYSKPDGIYWHMAPKPTESFCRFAKVDTALHSFTIRNDEAVMNQILHGNVSNTVHVQVHFTGISNVYPFHQRLQQMISFRKLTNH